MDLRDQALTRLGELGPEWGGGLSNHAPMVIDALLALDAPERVKPFLDHYLALVGAGETPPGWREARERLGAALAARPWRDVLAEQVRRLASALAAGAFHAVLRVAHATRGLGTADTPARRDELAAALATWQVGVLALPCAPGERRALTPAAALAALPPAPDALVPTRGLIEPVLLARAGAHPTLAAAIDWVTPEPLALMRAAAELLVCAERAPSAGFVLLHGVTGMATLPLLAPHLPADVNALLARHAWHALAALRVAYAGRLDARTPAGPAATPAALRARAVASLDDHVIKLTEACLRAHAATGAEVFLHAALQHG